MTLRAANPEVAADLDAWGRVAAVLRSLCWLAGEPQRPLNSPWAGPTAARSLELTAQTADGELQERLRAVAAQLRTLPSASQEERSAVLRESIAALEAVVPLSQVGGRALSGEPLSRLLPDKRRRNRPEDGGRGRRARREEQGDRPGAGPKTAEAPAAAEVAAEAAPESVSEAVVDAPAEAVAPVAPAPRPRQSAPEVDEVALAIAELRRHSSSSSAPAPEPAPLARHHLDHPERGGLSLARLEGLDPEVVSLLQQEDILTVADLVERAPFDHERPPMAPVGREIDEEGPATHRGRLLSKCSRLGPGDARRWEVVLGGRDTERLVFRWMSGSPRGFQGWRFEQELAFVGELHSSEEGAVVYEAEPVGLDGRGSGWLPRYGVEGLDEVDARDAVARALSLLQGTLKDFLPGAILDRHRLLPLDEALRDAHFPSNTSGRGRVRLAFQELLLLQVGVAWSSGRGQGGRGVAHKAGHEGLGKIGILHNLQLDDGQELAFSDIRRDLARPAPMTRLLQGDVGAGKGLVALMTAVVVAENRWQVAMVSPDSLSAERRFLFAEGILRSVGIVPLLVQGKVDRGQIDAIRRGEAHVVFGTPELLDGSVEWKRLGLVVVEERGPYGTVSPASLNQPKGARPDLLVVTRAPIPTSLAFTVFGEFDVSVVPAVEAPRVSSRVANAEERSAAYAEAQEQVARGRQAYVVFPVRDGRDLLSPDDALKMASALSVDAFPGARIGIYCSPMSRDERHRVYDDFLHRRIDVLVCTTHIEDAPMVANATVMVVEYADLHELVRLHQLRAHVGFGNHQGVCAFVLSDRPVQGALEMVQKVVDERDGFRLAEHDLQHRGAAALLADRAAEAPDFVWADPPQDRELLLRARAEAFHLLASDPRLRRHAPLARAVHARWGHWLEEPPPVSPASPQRPPAESTDDAGAGGGNRRRRRRRRKR